MCVAYNQIKKQITELDTQIKQLPEGTFMYTRNGKYIKWYQRVGNTLRYIKKEDQALAEKLAYKKFLTSQRDDLLREKSALHMYLKHHEINVRNTSQVITDSAAYRALLSSYLKSDSDEIQEWAQVPYERNQKYPEQLIHKTLSGNVVRSKSEVLIDMALFLNKIPYRYENLLTLNDITLCPDFTLRHPKTGQTLYWEHFGMMDQPVYIQNACSKLQRYSSHGLIPSIHVITTYETKDFPLTTELIEKIIDHYFR